MGDTIREQHGNTKIKVVGVGGGGSNAVSRMFRERLPSIEYMVVNTDSQALLRCDVPLRIGLGENLTLSSHLRMLPPRQIDANILGLFGFSNLSWGPLACSTVALRAPAPCS